MGNFNTPLSYLPPQSGRVRRVNSDGTITIICRICERIICRQPYQGFSTAICAVCSGEIARGKRPEDILMAAKVQEDLSTSDLYNDLGQGGFKAAGLGQRVKDVIDKIRIAATSRRRKPLLSKKDKV